MRGNYAIDVKARDAAQAAQGDADQAQLDAAAADTKAVQALADAAQALTDSAAALGAAGAADAKAVQALADAGAALAAVATLGTMATVNSPVPVANGGTGSTTAENARTALGLGTMATINSPVAVAKGGTGSTTAAAALTALGACADDVGVGGIGLIAAMRYSGGLVASGSTVAGSTLKYYLGASDSASAATGTWRNVTNETRTTNQIGVFQRIA